MKTLLVVSLLLGFLDGYSQNLSNRGKDFWVGYGHHQFMETGSNSQEMVLYLSAEEPANVTVTIEGTAWVRNYSIPANTVIASEYIPKAGAIDARLISVPCSFTGGVPPCGGEGTFSNKGIHIVSDVPIVAYAHIFGSASSGATMLMPVETWGYSYISLNSKQNYQPNCYSWVYAIAQHDNTVIEVTPAAVTRAGRPAGVPFTVTLNRGEIYQTMAGPESANPKPEMTGTKIRSIANPLGECYPIAVFSGSSRTYNTPAACGSPNGGDNDNQQCFPSQAWGKRYLTAPTSNSNTPSTPMTNTYKILVKDPTTVVKRNGVQIPFASLVSNTYYIFESNAGEYIEADKPIMVGQFIHSGSACQGGGGVGDPEMMYISPIEQGIKRTGFYRNNRESITVNYLTLIIPTNGLSTLTIDGLPGYDYSYAHPRLAGYTVIVKRWPAAQSQAIVSSDSAFTAITYGLGSVESYGYNAGTLINNLNAVSSIHNALDPTTQQHAFTCTNTPVELSVLMAYQPTRLDWNLSALSSVITPSADVVMNPAVSSGTVVINGITYYKYTLPGTYQFSAADTFDLPITGYHPSIENCYQREQTTVPIIVKTKPRADFTFTHSGCTLDPVQFTGNTSTSDGYTIGTFNWTFPVAPTTATGQNVNHLFPPGTHTINLNAVSTEGCVADTSKQVTVYDKPPADFQVVPSSLCVGSAFTMTDTSSGTIAVNNWYWDFGNGVTQTVTTGPSVTYTYPLPGTYTIKHVGKSSATCVSDTVTRTVTVYALPTASFTSNPPAGCLDETGVVQFNGAGTTPDGQTITGYSWNFGGTGTSTLQNPTHTFTTGTYTIGLTVTTNNGCVSSNTFPAITYNAKPAIAANAPVTICETTSTTLTVSGATTYVWSPATGLSGTTGASVTANPTTTTTYQVIGTANGCNDTTTTTVTVNPKPAKPAAVTPVNYCQNVTAAPLSATALGGHNLTWFNNSGLTGGTATAYTPSTTTPGTYYFYVNQTNSATGCISDTSRITVDITVAITNNSIGADQTICAGTSPATLTSTGTITGGTGIYTYQWEQSTDGGTTWTPIAGGTNATLNPSAVTGAIRYRRVVTDGSCTSTSNVVTITVQGSMGSFDIAASQIICNGSTPALLDGQTPVGGSGVFTYVWESSPDNTVWTAIAGATAEDYQPPAIPTTTYYRRKVSSGACSATSSVVTITVNPSPNGNITGPTAICSYDAGVVTFTATAGTGPFNVTITVNGPSGSTTVTQSVPNTSPTPITVLPVGSAGGAYTITLSNITDNTGCFRNTGLTVLNITVTPKPTLVLSANTAICAGSSSNLTASGATSYTWSPATGLSSTTGASVTANPATTTTYQVIGITNNCNDTNFVTVTVNPVPASPTATTSYTYCQNAAATVLTATAAAGNTLMWYNNPGLTGGSATAPTPSTATAGTTTWYVTQTNGFNCRSTATAITITVLPSIANNTITADQTLCAGTAAAALNSSGAPTGGSGSFNYTWEQSTDGGASWNVIAGAASQAYNPGSPTVTAQYRRVVNSGVCANTSNVVTITVQPQLTNINIAANQTICAGTAPALLDGQATAGGSGSFAYQWESSPDGSSWTNVSGATTEDYQPPALTATTHYRRKVTSGACNATSNVVIITVNTQPNGTITGPAAICSYNSAAVTFNATAGSAPFTVQVIVTAPGGGTTTISQTVPNSGPATINVIPTGSAAGTYTINLASITDNIGCSRGTGMSTVSIVVNAQPQLSFPPITAVCQNPGAAPTSVAGGIVTNGVNGTGVYSGPGTNSSGLFDPNIAGPGTHVITYTYTSTAGCGNSTTSTVTVHPRPTASFNVTADICQNQSATITDNSTIPSGSITTWNWSLGDGRTPSYNNGNPFTVNYTSANTFNVQLVAVSNNGCFSQPVSKPVAVHPMPVPNFLVPTGICMPGGLASFTNQSNVADNSAMTYLWNFGDAGTSTASNPTHTYAAIGSYNVTLTATSAFGCSTTSAPKVVSDFYDKPVAQFAVTPTELCQGVNTVFVDQSTAPGSTVQTWKWNFDDGSAVNTNQTPTKKFNTAGVYDVQLTVTNAVGCVDDTTIKVTVHLQPVIDAGRSFVVPQGTSIVFDATANSPSLTFNWTPPANLDDPGLLRPTLIANSDQTYTLTATGAFGCTATDFITVKILKPIEIPNAFSPNNDGIHDTWKIPNLADYPYANVSIFNRYGQRVWYSEGYGRPWDGTSNGKGLPVGVYYYVIDLKSGFKPLSGSVTILK